MQFHMLKRAEVKRMWSKKIVETFDSSFFFAFCAVLFRKTINRRKFYLFCEIYKREKWFKSYFVLVFPQNVFRIKKTFNKNGVVKSSKNVGLRCRQQTWTILHDVRNIVRPNVIRQNVVSVTRIVGMLPTRKFESFDGISTCRFAAKKDVDVNVGDVEKQNSDRDVFKRKLVFGSIHSDFQAGRFFDFRFEQQSRTFKLESGRLGVRNSSTEICEKRIERSTGKKTISKFQLVIVFVFLWCNL